jgi:hypothetical protein
MGYSLALFDVERVFAQSWAVFHELQTLLAALLAESVVLAPRFLTDQKDDFGDLFLFRHATDAPAIALFRDALLYGLLRKTPVAAVNVRPVSRGASF